MKKFSAAAALRTPFPEWAAVSGAGYPPKASSGRRHRRLRTSALNAGFKSLGGILLRESGSLSIKARFDAARYRGAEACRFRIMRKKKALQSVYLRAEKAIRSCWSFFGPAQRTPDRSAMGLAFPAGTISPFPGFLRRRRKENFPQLAQDASWALAAAGQKNRTRQTGQQAQGSQARLAPPITPTRPQRSLAVENFFHDVHI